MIDFGQVIIDGMEQTEQALKVLAPHTDFLCTIDNEEHFVEPRLRFCQMRESSQQLLWTLRLKAIILEQSISLLF